MVMKTILAVAVSDSPTNIIIADAQPGSRTGARPYIDGLIDRLTTFGDIIGTHYVIEYRECRLGQFNFTVTTGQLSAVLCMSTSVTNAAVAVVAGNIPIVAVVSKHSNYPGNVCGVTAQRSQIARKYYDRFLDTVPSLQTVYVLCKDGYEPSDDSKGNIEQGQHARPRVFKPVSSPWGEAEISAVIDTIPANTIGGVPAGSGGLLILPVDHFFGCATKIIGWARARHLPDFWPVTDWVQNDGTAALGGYGVPQARCGQLMADKIHDYWETGNLPQGQNRFHMVKSTDYVWLASTEAALAVPVTLSTNVPKAGQRKKRTFFEWLFGTGAD